MPPKNEIRRVSVSSLSPDQYIEFLLSKDGLQSSGTVTNLKVRNAFRPAIRKMLGFVIDGNVVEGEIGIKDPMFGDKIKEFLKIMSDKKTVNVRKFYEINILNTGGPTERQLVAVLLRYPELKKLLLSEIDLIEKSQ